MRDQIISRSASADPGLMDYLSKKGATWGMETEKHDPWKTGQDRNRLYSWKVIPRESEVHGKYVLVHITPGRIKNDPDPIHKLREAVKASCSLNLQNTQYAARGIDEPEFGIYSFCVSFAMTPHWRALAELFLGDVEKSFHRWLH